MLMLKIKPCMCKFKDQVGWNCGRLIITVIVSLVSRYKDNFVNDKANTWDDPGSILLSGPRMRVWGKTTFFCEKGCHDNWRKRRFLQVTNGNFWSINLLVVSRTTKIITDNEELGFDIGEGALQMATTSKEGSRRVNYPLSTRRGSDDK